MTELTRRQRQILEYIISKVRGEERFPSYREIGRRFRLSSSATVSQHLEALIRKGFLEKAGRRLMLSADLRPARGVPVVGRVAAGTPITAIENREGYVDVASLFGDEGDHFAVRVKGDSMVDAGILEGDYVVVRQDEDVASGDTVVAYVGDEMEATVKVFRRRGKTVELHPRNEAYRPMRFGPGSGGVRIAGKVVGLVRKMR
jgi:repressor LexA